MDGSRETIGWKMLILVPPLLFVLRHHEIYIWGFDWNVSTTTGLTVMKFAADIHVPMRMNFNIFDHPLTFHVVASSGPYFNFLYFGFMTKH